MGTGTGIGRVRGLGSAKRGAEHWAIERLYSLGALLLGVWFLVSLLLLPSLDRATVADWLSSPWAAVPMILFIGVNFRHLLLGLQVIVDDYVHEEGSKILVSTLLKFASFGAAALGIFAVLRLAFGAAGAPAQ